MFFKEIPSWVVANMGRGMLPLSTFLRNPCRERCLGSDLLRSEGTSILDASSVPYTSTRETVLLDPNAFCMIPNRRAAGNQYRQHTVDENHLVCRVSDDNPQCWGIKIAGLNLVL
jgi:hypothetical protein